MDAAPDDRANGDTPSRDPGVADALARAMQAMRSADNLFAKLIALRDGAADIDRLGDDGSGALDRSVRLQRSVLSDIPFRHSNAIVRLDDFDAW